MIFDWHIVIGIVSGLVTILAIIPYIKDILHGTTRPNIVSWALWTLLLAISLLAQLSAGASWSALMIFADLIGTAIILILCLSGYGYKKYGATDWICAVLAVVAIVVWQLEHQPVLAIALAALADFLAAIPTLIKSWQDPWSEDPTQFLIISGGGLLALFSTTIIDPANLLFPAYLFALNGTIGLVALFGRRAKIKG
jgi:hypothetical protein